jgi:lysophospholipase L1-like esterase
MWKRIAVALVMVGLVAGLGFAEAPENMLKNGDFTIDEGQSKPSGWTCDKGPRENVTEGLPKGVTQALKVTIHETVNQDGYTYQVVKPADGFATPSITIGAWIKADVKGGAFLQVKLYKGKKRIALVSFGARKSGPTWQRIEKTLALKGADNIHVLCRARRRGAKMLNTNVWFANASVTASDKAPKKPKADNYKTAKVKIVVLGDSTVQTFPEDGDLRGWGQTLGDYFTKDVGVHNHAKSGRSSKSFITEGRLKVALADKADYAFIQFGHNDSHNKKEAKATTADGDFKDYLRQYVDAFAKTNTKVIFVTPMHRRTWRKNGKMTDNLMPYATAMKEVAKEKGCPLVDLHAMSGELLRKMGNEPSNVLGARGGTDRTHWNEKGAQAMTKLIIKGLIEVKSPLVEYLTPKAKLIK